MRCCKAFTAKCKALCSPKLTKLRARPGKKSCHLQRHGCLARRPPPQGSSAAHRARRKAKSASPWLSKQNFANPARANSNPPSNGDFVLMKRRIVSSLATSAQSPENLAGNGAPDRSRTGMTFVEGFSCHFGFRRQRRRCSWSGLCLGPSSLPEGPRRQVSARSLHRGLRSASPRVSRGFAEFDGIHAETFVLGCSIFTSPLRLPISPRVRCFLCCVRCRWHQI